MPHPILPTPEKTIQFVARVKIRKSDYISLPGLSEKMEKDRRISGNWSVERRMFPRVEFMNQSSMSAAHDSRDDRATAHIATRKSPTSTRTDKQIFEIWSLTFTRSASTAQAAVGTLLIGALGCNHGASLTASCTLLVALSREVRQSQKAAP